MLNVFIRNSRCLILYLSFFTVSSYGNKIYVVTYEIDNVIYNYRQAIDNCFAPNRIHTIIIYYAQCVCTQLTRSIIYVRNINIMCNFLILWTFFFLSSFNTTAVIFIILFSSRLDFNFNYSCFFRRFTPPQGYEFHNFITVFHPKYFDKLTAFYTLIL